MKRPTAIVQVLCLTLSLTTFQIVQAGTVNWVWCGTDEWDSGECWGGFSSPDSDDRANVYPDAFFSDVNVQIVPGDENVAREVHIYTHSPDDTSRITQTGGSLTIGTKLAEDTWSGGLLSIGYALDSGTSAYYLSDGILTARYEEITPAEAFDARFFQKGGVNIMEQLSVGGPPSATGLGFYSLDGGTLQAQEEFIGYENRGFFSHSKGINVLSGVLSVGTLATGEGTYVLSEGLLNTNATSIGFAGTGVFTQSGGFHQSSELRIGSKDTGMGAYSMLDGDLFTPDLIVGLQGYGVFVQNGGDTQITNRLVLGSEVDSEGSYTLDGGRLFVNRIGIGPGSSTFNLNGGTLNLTGPSIDVESFNIGNGEGSQVGLLNMGEGKTFTTDHLFLGRGSDGVINQTGGTVTVYEDLIMGYFSADESGNSTYLLSGGDLVARNVTLNRCFSAGSFNQTGGTSTIKFTLTLTEHCGTATYLLAGGTLDVRNIENGTGTGNFLLSGGILRALDIDAEDMAVFDFSGGTLSVLRFYGTLLNKGGNLSRSGTSAITYIYGDYTQSAEAQMTITLRDQASGVRVNGVAEIAGELQVLLGDGFNVQEGDSFTLIHAEAINGVFSKQNLPVLPQGLEWALNFLADEIGSQKVLELRVKSSSEVIFMDGFQTAEIESTEVLN